jgi:2-keto-4-pentenoate hydratase/2-oxohepta-3-ene-1,7-dioic acid hydratase in catechol pathway
MNVITRNGRTLAPTKVICIGRNYAAHIRELGNETPEGMVLFTKPNSAIATELCFIDDDCHYEAEMAFVVEAGQLRGVGLGLDLTKRAEQARLKAKGLPWERAKAFDGAAVFSSFVDLPPVIESLHFRLHINGQLAQQGSYGQMIHKPRAILAEVSSFMSLEDGDILMTGTPEGVGPYGRGDVFEARLYAGDQELLRTTWLAR